MGEQEMQIPSMELLEEELKREQHKRKVHRGIRGTLFSLLVAVAIMILIVVLLMPILQISGGSMTDTLNDGDVVIALNNAKYSKGDVIAFYYNDSILTKRAIATAGDWVDIDESGNVFVNGKMLTEPYVSEKAVGNCNITLPYQVPAGKCFVMGDCRETSIDSRNSIVGCVKNEMVIGRVLFRIWPLKDIGTID